MIAAKAGRKVRGQSFRDRINWGATGSVSDGLAKFVAYASGSLDHFRVCTSTERTAGRSRTIGIHESPASGEQYTWPPVVPK